MKISRLVLTVTALLLGLSSLPVHAQFGGLGKKLTGGGGFAGADISGLAAGLFEKATPVSEKLTEASKHYAVVFSLQEKINKMEADAKTKDGQAVLGFKMLSVISKEMAEYADHPEKLQLTQEQGQELLKAQAKVKEAWPDYMVVAGSTALAIKNVTDKNPAALASQPQLAYLGLACTKDLGTFAKMASMGYKLAKAKGLNPPGDEHDFQPPK
jgi:ABC-type Na+ efflux pump permease subunit